VLGTKQKRVLEIEWIACSVSS